MSKEDLIPFKKGQSGNPKGRPKKLVSHINAELANEGYTPVQNANITAAYLTIIQLPIDEIKEIANPNKKKDFPFLYKLVAKELIGKRGSEMLERLLDRSFGKSTQRTDITTKGKEVGLTALSDDELLHRIEKLKKDVK